MPYLPEMNLTLGPRPGRKSLQRLRALNLTHCATLLSEREGARQIEALCPKLGESTAQVVWVWLAMEGGNLARLEACDVAALVATLKSAVEGTPNPHVYLHCSAGIHRTGFMAYVLLRLMGRSEDEARIELATLREVTFRQVEEPRLKLAERKVLEILNRG